jgi:hypothetical protein
VCLSLLAVSVCVFVCACATHLVVACATHLVAVIDVYIHVSVNVCMGNVCV